MKIRNGFVSNSSSSSFILDSNKYTCVDVAIDMITQYIDHLKEYDDDNNEYLNKEKKLYIERLNKLEDKNHGIFYIASDDIEIAKVDDKIYVEATNHVDWELDTVGWGDEGEYYEKFENVKWFFPQIDNKHRGTFVNDSESWVKEKYDKKWIYSCDNKDCSRHTRYIVKEGQVFCPNCMTDPNGNKVAFRLEKLERILEEDDGDDNDDV